MPEGAPIYERMSHYVALPTSPEKAEDAKKDVQKQEGKCVLHWKRIIGFTFLVVAVFAAGAGTSYVWYLIQLSKKKKLILSLWPFPQLSLKMTFFSVVNESDVLNHLVVNCALNYKIL